MCQLLLIYSLPMIPCSFVKEVLGCKAILRCFELVSGLKINLGKSTMIGIEMAKESLKEFAEDIGCGTRRTPFSYLGLLVGGNPRRKSFWSPVIEKVERRLTGWVGNTYL